jgi:RNA polymerase sigma-70 factor, ECF subfamily
MQDAERELIRKAAQKDEVSFGKIFSLYKDYVYNVVFRILLSSEDAREVTQEVFVKVYYKLAGFRHKSSLKTWIYRIGVNTAINYLKKESKFRDKTCEYDDSLENKGASDILEDKINKEHKEYTINKLLNCLTPEQRACVVLNNIEGFSYEETAKILNIKVNSVRSRLKRAREKLLAFKSKAGLYEV